jgi:ABC-type multidrug transport system fused ATPase/permease subunit
MFDSIRKIWLCFTLSQKKQIFKLQLLVFFISLFEIITILSVVGFMRLVSDVNSIIKYPAMHEIHGLIGGGNDALIVTFSLVLILILTVNASLSVLITNKINIKAFSIGKQISVQLFSYYQSRDWLYHTQKNSNELINKTLTETNRLSSGILHPMLLLMSRAVLIVLMLFSLVIYDPFVTSFGGILFVSGYVLAYKFSRTRLSANSIV